MSRVAGDRPVGQDPPADEPPPAQDAAARAAEEAAGRVVEWVIRAAARAREEAEDVWAEARELRSRW